jgi:hypothetical protein
VTSSPTPGSIVSFRQGVIDSTGSHGTKDAKLLPNRELAVLTYGNGCTDRPDSVTGSGHQVTINYVPPKIPPGTVCANYLAPFTAVVRLPASVDASLPLSVTVQNSGANSYTIPAR